MHKRACLVPSFICLMEHVAKFQHTNKIGLGSEGEQKGRMRLMHYG